MIDFIEKAGTGIRRIREEARAGGYPEPVFEANGFTTAIFRPSSEAHAAADVRSSAETGRQVTPQVPRSIIISLVISLIFWIFRR